MTGWRFYPLDSDPRAGVLVSPERKPKPAVFLTPDEARERAQRQRMGLS
jgi:hypothetical protein